MKAIARRPLLTKFFVYWGETSAFIDDFKGYRYPEFGARITYSSHEKIVIPGEFL